MKNFLPIIVTLLFGLSPTYADEAKPPRLIEISIEAYSELVYGRELDRFDAFNDACTFLKYDCSKTLPPTVVYGSLPYKLLGKYGGKDTIYVLEGLYGYTRKMVLMHETVHYLQVKINGLILPGYAHSVCHAEAEAFTVVDNWLRSVGQYKLIVGPLWWQGYSYCRPWFDPGFKATNPLNQWNSPII